MPVVKSCSVCNKQFSVPPVRAESAKTCSQKCRGVLIAQSYEEKRPVHHCKWCDKTFTSPPSHADRRTYCSMKCADEAKIGTYNGPLAPDGTMTQHSDGYVLERDVGHPFKVNESVLQHRLVMERWMREESPEHSFLIEVDGVRYLRREIHVHHRNEVKDDNARSNLMACTAAAHKDVHQGHPIMKGTSWPERGDEIEAEERTVKRGCGVCGKSFMAKRSDIMRGGAKYCSIPCRSVAQIGKPLKRKP